MGAQRFQPSRARVGGDPRLPDRRKDVRPQGPGFFGAGIPEAAAQFHVVGKPQGFSGQ